MYDQPQQERTTVSSSYPQGIASATTPKISEVEQEMQELAATIDVLSSATKHLESRLGGVLRMEPENIKDVGVPTQNRTPLADAIRARRFDVVKILHRIESIASRLEI